MASTRRAAQREETRESLLDAAQALFAERGVLGTSVEKISDRAGLTRGAFYANFKDRAAIVEELARRQQGRILADVAAALASDTARDSHIDAALAALVDRVLDTMPHGREPWLLHSELEAYAIRHPEVAGSYRQMDAKFREQLAALIERTTRLLGRELILEPAEVATAAIAVVLRSGRDALLDDALSPQETARALLPALFLGLSRPVRRGVAGTDEGRADAP
jgi:AcrR family transcriptional regulator